MPVSWRSTHASTPADGLLDQVIDLLALVLIDHGGDAIQLAGWLASDITSPVPVLEPVDESYFDVAPQRFSHTWSIARPADAVWAELVSERPLHWLRGLRLIWTSPRPFGVGTTRRGKMLGGLATVDEHFFIWEEGRRYAFYAIRSTLPSFASFAEDYLVEPAGSETCRFTWRIALTPSRIGRSGARLNKLLFERAFRDTGRYFNAA